LKSSARYYYFLCIPNWAGAAGNTKRATSVVLVQKPKDAAAEHSEAYAEALEEVTKVQLVV
jgi:hypothetical protein